MNAAPPITVGIVGVCGGYGRGRLLAQVCLGLPSIQVQALCDLDGEGLLRANRSPGVPDLYADYAQMLEQSRLDAVILATPMDLHVPQAITALQRGVHVVSEVTAAVSLAQCRALVPACRASQAIYMLAENANFTREVVVIRELVRRGLFGTPDDAEGGYVADAKALAEVTPWRRRWHLGVNGIPAITHNLGPILQWLPGERITAVCCTGAGHHDRDPRGQAYEAEATCTMLGRTTRGHQVVIRSDFLSNRPGSGVSNDLQGTEGCSLSPRVPGEPHRIWLTARPSPSAWEDLRDLAEDLLPDSWRQAVVVGVGDECDRVMVHAFVDAMRGVTPPSLGIDAAMDLTVPGLVSQASIAAGGRWLAVPDSRTW